MGMKMKVERIWTALAVLSLLAILLPGTGCIASAEFTPRSAQRNPPTTERPIRVYEDDLGPLANAGGRVIGSISAKGNSFASYETLTDRAATETAENGGTHFILTDKGMDYLFVTTEGQSDTKCTGSGDQVRCKSRYTPPETTAYEKPTAGFIAIRVPPENWSQLPPALRPALAPGLTLKQRSCNIPGVYIGRVVSVVSGDCPTSSSRVVDTFTVNGTSATLSMFEGAAICTGKVSNECTWEAYCEFPSGSKVQYSWTFTSTGFSGISKASLPESASLSEGCVGSFRVMGEKQ